jgi:hypothetical protein
MATTAVTDRYALGKSRPVCVLRSVGPEIMDSTHAVKVKTVLITGGVLSNKVRGVTS